MPLSGQPVGDEGQGPRSTPAIPGSDIYEIKYTNKRTNVVRLLPNGAQERKLRKLASISARLFNEVNYERRQQFFRGGRVDLRGTWNKYYEKYKGKLGVSAQAVLQKSDLKGALNIMKKAEGIVIKAVKKRCHSQSIITE